MIGNLYIIKNTVNDKVYIGKTYNTIEQRFKEHKQDARRESRKHNKFQRAIRKYGEENFYIELLGQFEEGLLEDKEIEYIAKYDSYHNGYNSTLGGDSGKILELDEGLIIDDWENGMSINGIARKHSVGPQAIRSVLINNNLYSIKEPDEKIKIWVYDKMWNRVKLLESRAEAIKYIENVLNMSIPYSVCQRLDEACSVNKIAFNSYWQKPDDLFFNGKEFNSTYDKEQFIMGKKCVCLDNLWFAEIQRNKTYLNLENKKIEKIKKKKIIVPTKEELSELVNFLSTKDISLKFNVSETTVRSWVRKYSLIGNHKQKINSLHTEVLKLYEMGKSAKRIAKELGTYPETVRDILKKNNIDTSTKLKSEHIGKYDKLTGELLGEFDTYNAAWKSCGEKDFADKIRLCVEGKRKSAGGYIWKKIE